MNFTIITHYSMKQLTNVLLTSMLIYNLQPIVQAAKNYNYYIGNYNSCMNEVGYENDSQGIKHLNCI